MTPGDGKGPFINGVQTDVITVVYRDSASNFDQDPLLDINPEGTLVTFDPSTIPPYNDPVVGLKVGDILLLTNSKGSAAAVVTGLPVSGDVELSESDPLQYNQPDAAAGNVKAILSPPAAPDFPPTSAYRIHVVTYYLDASDPDSTRLMRQVNAYPPGPVAEDVEDLQFTYDIFDDNTAIATADLPDAGGSPNQIRQSNITLKVRSSAKGMMGQDIHRVALTTSVGPRNLTYRDRYE